MLSIHEDMNDRGNATPSSGIYDGLGWSEVRGEEKTSYVAYMAFGVAVQFP